MTDMKNVSILERNENAIEYIYKLYMTDLALSAVVETRQAENIGRFSPAF